MTEEPTRIETLGTRLLPFIAGAALGTYFLITSSGFGVGLSVDSASYAGAARSLAWTGRLDVPITSWRSATPLGPLVYVPPLLPLVLSLFERSGIGAVEGARYLNATLVALTFGVCLRLVLRPRMSRGRRLLGVGLMTAAFLGRSLGFAHLWLWSEPLFLPLCLLALLAAIRLAESPSPWVWGASAGLLIGLAMLTRYAGVFLFPVCAGWILSRTGARGFPWCARAVGAMALGSGLVFAPWYARLRAVGSKSPRTFGLFPDQVAQIGAEQLSSLGRWVLGPAWSADAALLLGGAALALATIALVRVLLTAAESTSRLLAAAALWYLTFLLVISAVVRPAIEGDVDGRLISPFVLIGALSLATWTTPATLESTHGAGIRTTLGIALVLFMSSAHQASPKFRQSRTWGLGFEREPFRRSATLAWLRANPPSGRVTSNSPAAVYFGTGRPASLALSDGDAADAGAFHRFLRGSGGLHVALRDELWAGQMDTASLTRLARLSPVATFEDGAVYAAVDGGS